MMQKIIYYCLACSILLMGCENETSEKQSNEVVSEYQLVWSDEFGGALLDTTKWNYDIGDGCPRVCGWGNSEAQYYTDRKENVRIEDGKLIIEARKEVIENSGYTSSRIKTRQKGDWLYGKFETRAKLPSGRGTWPAIWMLPTEKEYGGWPRSGEIDIMEHVGHVEDYVYGTIHTEAFNHRIGTQIGDSIRLLDFETAFHTYTLEWTEDSLKWLVDDVQYFGVGNQNKTSAEWPFDKKFHLILNLAVGGNWGGEEGIDDTIFPKQMEVDYVRVYQKKPLDTKE